jgi:hypothetical protein
MLRGDAVVRAAATDRTTATDLKHTGEREKGEKELSNRASAHASELDGQQRPLLHFALSSCRFFRSVIIARGNFVAFDATNGTPLWHSRIGNISNAPETYLIDGRQHVLVAVADTLYAFQLY